MRLASVFNPPNTRYCVEIVEGTEQQFKLLRGAFYFYDQKPCKPTGLNPGSFPRLRQELDSYRRLSHPIQPFRTTVR